MITCDLGWRLGNQLFQVATTVSLAARVGDEAVFQKWEYLPIFKNPVKLGSPGQIDFTYKEPAFHFSPIPEKKNTKLVGYFQSDKYFEPSVVRHYFDLKDNIKSYIQGKYGTLLEKKTVGIHVRRGDYLKFPKHHPVMTMDYYNKAISYFLEGSTFVVFSDDIPWCKENFPKDFTFIEGEKEDYVDMFLMALMKHNIIGNSSFSWWPAWLNGNPEKVVIAPQRWFGSAYAKHDLNDLFPDTWIKI